jgi:hypothetical protein
MKRSKFFNAKTFYQLSDLSIECDLLLKEPLQDIFEESSASFK